MATRVWDLDEQARRQALSQLGQHWQNGWTTRKQDGYAMAVRDLSPDEVQAGVNEAIETWGAAAGQRGCPPAAVVRQFALRSRAAVKRQAQAEIQVCSICATGKDSGVGWLCDDHCIPPEKLRELLLELTQRLSARG